MKTNIMTNAVEPAAPMSVWGKGCAGKGGATHNAAIINSANNTNNEKETK